MPFFEKLMTFKIPRGKTTNSIINPRALQNPLAFLPQVRVVSSHSAHAQPGSILSYPAIPATSMGCQRTSVMAMAGPCSVPGEAWASPCWRGSSAHWPRHSTLRGHPYKNPDKKTGPCDLGGSEERLWDAQPGQSHGLTPEEVAHQRVGAVPQRWEVPACGTLLQTRCGHRHCK